MPDQSNKKAKGRKLRIALVTSPLPLYTKYEDTKRVNFLDILRPLCESIFVLSGNLPPNAMPGENIHIRSVKHSAGKGSAFVQILNHLTMQLKIAFNLLKILKDVDIVILYIANIFLPCVMLAKLARLKVALVTTGSSAKLAKTMPGIKGNLLSLFFGIVEGINFRLADQLVVESSNVASFMGLGKYNSKIVVNSCKYINTTQFKVTKNLRHREELVGYVGRLTYDKGVMNFAQAIPLILNERGHVDFLICGDGPLLEQLRSWLGASDFGRKVRLTGWVSHDGELPRYLNEMKLLVLSSYSEGLPTIVLEAMACGAIVLATPVGGVPDLICDGETGFIMRDNSPSRIAQNVVRVLNHPNLNQIASNARKLIEQEYSFRTAVERSRLTLNQLIRRKSTD